MCIPTQMLASHCDSKCKFCESFFISIPFKKHNSSGASPLPLWVSLSFCRGRKKRLVKTAEERTEPFEELVDELKYLSSLKSTVNKTEVRKHLFLAIFYFIIWITLYRTTVLMLAGWQSR